jgi:hypothetical protein
MSSTILVLPDSHAHPEFSNDRFIWAGKLIHDIKPDVVINIGDLADMASLCFHSKKIELEGARYQADCDASIDAQEKLFHEVRKHKKKQPRWIWTMGNHDVRPQRFVDENPVFEGKLKNEDIGYEDFPWEMVPFLEPIEVEGIDFQHYVTSGLMGRPVGGTHPAWSIIKKRNKSSVVGHSHVVDYKVDKTPGRSLMGLAVGCYCDYEAGYAGPANDMWSRGIAVLHNAEDGVFDFEWISMNRIKQQYG